MCLLIVLVQSADSLVISPYVCDFLRPASQIFALVLPVTYECRHSTVQYGTQCSFSGKQSSAINTLTPMIHGALLAVLC
ncbi:hypothetical protein KC19_6G205300 [Ceratodon purpureus]|uniref:Uncharacterized protein n=1 Tax=Ceratodon purpureus TaxID=3225 RepID=A0A8T0HJP4_CERPU|nr:hypothetical protein KC19_6G205300 [Ceratodon purpureus]